MTPAARTVFENEWMQVKEETFPEAPSLQGRPHYRIEVPDGILVFARTSSGEIVLVRQFRPTVRDTTLEFPSGAVDENERPIDAAVRELYEETGYRCRELVPVGIGRALINRIGARQHLFYGTDAKRDPRHVAEPGIDTVLVSPVEFHTMVVEGRFQLLPALGLLVLCDWKLGTSLVRDLQVSA